MANDTITKAILAKSKSISRTLERHDQPRERAKLADLDAGDLVDLLLPPPAASDRTR